MKKLLLILSAALALAACKDENPVFTISTEELKFDANGGEQKVFISTNRDWTAQVPQTDTWYTVSALSGTSDTEVTVTVEPYEDATPENLYADIRHGSRTAIFQDHPERSCSAGAA